MKHLLFWLILECTAVAAHDKNFCSYKTMRKFVKISTFESFYSIGFEFIIFLSW